MSCYHPLKAYRTTTGVSFNKLRRDDHVGDIELPCGMCIGCRMRRASDWSLRVMHEASLWPENCFVTLTYGRDCLPPDSSLEHRDFQLFMKRLRKRFRRTVRFYMCGEYGPVGGRPHYHACLFNADFRNDRKVAGKSGSGTLFYESAELEKLWGHGRCSVQDLVPETASYCARYIMKKVLGEEAKTAYNVVDADGVIIKRRPEYAAMSLKPGIGAGWFDKFFKSDVFPQDFVVQSGVERQVPKYYDKLYHRKKLLKEDEIEFARQQRAMLAQAENSDERRRVREVVHLAKVSTLKRGDL